MTSIFKFSSKLFILLIVALALHLGVLYLKELPLFENMILASYVVNFLLAAGIYAGLFKLKESQPNNMGFIFMAGSFVKFGAFFLLFYPAFKADGNMSTLEFSSFFIPYLLCLVLETVELSKMLNNLKK